jgi:hypothetical protein
VTGRGQPRIPSAWLPKSDEVLHIALLVAESRWEKAKNWSEDNLAPMEGDENDRDSTSLRQSAARRHGTLIEDIKMPPVSDIKHPTTSWMLRGLGDALVISLLYLKPLLLISRLPRVTSIIVSNTGTLDGLGVTNAADL